jgi:hypothetical protein
VTNVMSSRFADAMVNTGGACMVVVAIAALDERVRGYLTSMFTSDPSRELMLASVRVQRVARFVLETADGPGSEPVALALVAVTSVLLATLMLRS